MNPSRVFIGRPVATTLLTIAIALVGIAAFTVLPVSPLPQVDFPTITVAASLPGGSPDIMASAIATPLERQFGHIAGVTEMTSSSTLGTTSITLQFDLSRDINGAARDVEAGINAARSYLPANLPANPTYRKVNPGRLPDHGARAAIRRVRRADALRRGVVSHRAARLADLRCRPGKRGGCPAVRVELNPSKLTHYGISLPSVATAISGQNSNLAQGQLSNGTTTSDIVVNSQIAKAEDYKPLVIGYSNGAVIRLTDVADVVDSQQNVRQAGFLNGRPSVNMIIFRQPAPTSSRRSKRSRRRFPRSRPLSPRACTSSPCSTVL